MLRGYLNDNSSGLLSGVGGNNRQRLGAFAGALALSCMVAVAPGYAFDAQEGVAEEGQAKSWMTFRFGFSAYKKGKKDEAFRAYSDAAKEGHIGARWKLANMYAAGDGVKENDYEAFKLFRGIINEGAPQGSQESAFVSNALVSIAGYMKSGIEGSPVKADPARARDIYWQAAANFGDSNAQFMLARMFLNGEGGAVDKRQAGRWFNLSARKGHAGSRAMLGKMMFEAGKTVEGIGLLTAALETAPKSEHGWIRNLQEEAFALSSEAERRTGIAYGQSLLNK